ncbi:MAG TPA: GntG family PLP-dependent aldolase [Terracidiphilus sp.]|nr:GntG family PLP-dependent aldolase [Terracidiphilus sp.]
MADETDWIDLRSDTVTRPTPEMRTAMAAAEVGDDVYGEDPTINLLERRAAEIFGREAGLFVPTGTMGNQIALRLLTQPGQEIICDARAHILDWEMASAAVFSGCLLRTLPTANGILSWEQIEPVIYGRGNFRAATGAVELENTHNMAGGRVTPPAVMEEICAKAKDKGLGVHLDGARIFNAATALGLDVKTLTRGFDTVMFCLSKGLCAPVGSMLVGSAERMAQARIYRKALGGGMRQAGVLAAAGLIALEIMPKRLHEDHANAKLLAEALANLEGVEIDPETVETNIVIFRVREGISAPEVIARLKARGVLASTVGPNAIRLVTHNDVSRGHCMRAAEVLSEEIELMQGVGSRE